MENTQKAYDIDVELELRRREGVSLSSTVIGLVNPDGTLSHSIVKHEGNWVSSDDSPSVYIALNLERAITTDRRFVIIIGGRSSSKSVAVADICLVKAKDDNAKSYFLREYQSSVKNSVHSLLKDEISRLEFEGFEVQQQSILHDGEDIFQFAGIARNIESIKSSHGFSVYAVEESQFLSQESLDVLTPTARNKPNKGLPRSKEEKADDTLSSVQMFFVANPMSEADAFSTRFIKPFQKELDANGFYEDELHTIIVMNYDQNPWHIESGLEAERVWAKKNLSDALYSHVWLGSYNDSVENSLITGEMFDACVDAHIKLGFKPEGAKIASHDPSDLGRDSKGYVMRHGSVVLAVEEYDDGNVNEGARWATGLAIQHGVNYFTYDSIGMGASLGEQISNDFKEKNVRVVAFNSSESPDSPDAIYKPAQSATITEQRRNKDVFRNKRVQYYAELRDRMYRTYRAVVEGEYCNPDDLLSISSDIKCLSKLKSEVCRMPIKPNGNGYLDLWRKDEMKSKFNFNSPNISDSLMMSLRYQSIDISQPYIPRRVAGFGR